MVSLECEKGDCNECEMKKQIKIFSDVTNTGIEKQVNEFVTKVEVVDIKFSIAVDAYRTFYAAMVIFKESK